MPNRGPLKILLIIPNLGRGGAQKVFHQQLKYLPDTFEVVGCVFNWDGAFTEDRNENILSLDIPEGKTYFDKAWFFVLRIIRLRKIKQLKQIDVSISHLEGADYVNILSKRNEKIICWIHGTKRHDENINGLLGSLRMKILIPWLYRHADRLVTVSKGISGELATHIKGAKKITQTIYNGFENDKIITLSNESLDPKFVLLFQKHTIISHCRLSRQKNLGALILIFSQLNIRDKMKLVILGDGELREELLAYGNQLGLNCWNCWSNEPLNTSFEVYFMGEHRNPFKFLRHSTLYLMTSGWEGFPLALCEALVCGLPVMTSDCFTGPREIIAPEIRLPQPVKTPYTNEYGILMPMAEASNAKVISLWVREIEKFIAIHDTKGTQDTLGIDRIKEFTLSESILQTTNLIREISK